LKNTTKYYNKYQKQILVNSEGIMDFNYYNYNIIAFFLICIILNVRAKIAE